MSTITWLHLLYPHFRAEEQDTWDQSPVRPVGLEGWVNRALALLLLLLGITACGGPASPTPDAVATKISAQATMTALAPTPAPATPVPSTATPPPTATSTPDPVQPSHKTPGTPTPLNAQLSCDEKPLSKWGPAGTYRYRITGGGDSAEYSVERETGKKDSREYYYFCDPTSDSALFSAHIGESLSAPPKVGASGESLCRPRAAVIEGGGTVSIQVVGVETKTTELGTFETIRVDTRMEYSFTTGLHDTFERVDEKKEWYACGYGLVLSTVSVAESKYGMELKPRSGTVTLISFTPIIDW